MKDELEKLKRVKSKKRKRSSINERACNTDAVRSFHHYGFGAYKISDVTGSNFTSDKPCDIIACSKKGRYIAVESKLIKKWGGFNSKVLRPNQIFELDGATIKRQGRAFVFLFVRIKADKEKGNKRVHKLCVFDWKLHRGSLMNKGYSIEVIKTQAVGVWFDPIKRKDGKTIYNISKLLKRGMK